MYYGQAIVQVVVICNAHNTLPSTFYILPCKFMWQIFSRFSFPIYIKHVTARTNYCKREAFLFCPKYVTSIKKRLKPRNVANRYRTSHHFVTILLKNGKSTVCFQSPGRKPKCTICSALVENKAGLAAHVKHHGKGENSFAVSIPHKLPCLGDDFVSSMVMLWHVYP